MSSPIISVNSPTGSHTSLITPNSLSNISDKSSGNRTNGSKSSTPIIPKFDDLMIQILETNISDDEDDEENENCATDGLSSIHISSDSKDSHDNYNNSKLCCASGMMKNSSNMNITKRNHDESIFLGSDTSDLDFEKFNTSISPNISRSHLTEDTSRDIVMDFADILEQFYLKYDPSKISLLNEIIESSESNEFDLIQTLKQTYKVEIFEPFEKYLEYLQKHKSDIQSLSSSLLIEDNIDSYRNKTPERLVLTPVHRLYEEKTPKATANSLNIKTPTMRLNNTGEFPIIRSSPSTMRHLDDITNNKIKALVMDVTSLETEKSHLEDSLKEMKLQVCYLI